MKNESTKEANGKPTPPTHPSNVFTMTQQQERVMMNDRSQSTTTKKQLTKGDDSKSNTTFAGTSTYLLSQSTATSAEMPTDCAPSRDDSSSSFPDKSSKEPKEHQESPTQQQGRRVLYLSKPQTSNHNRPMPLMESQVMNHHEVNSPPSVIMNSDPTNVNSTVDEDDVDLEAPNNTTPEVFVQAEVARDLDSIVNQAVTEALRERDRNIVSAVHVEPDPSPPSDDENANQKTEYQDGSLQEQRKRIIGRKFLIYLGVSIAAIAIVAAVVIFLQTFSSNASGSANKPEIELVGSNKTSTNGDESSTLPTKAPSPPSPPILPKVKETNQFPLGRCEGDCDTDLDCRQGMVCFQRNGFEPVPQCSGGENDESRTDYCIPIEPTPSPSPAPTGPTSLPSLSPSSAPTPKPTQDTLRLEAITASLGDDLFPHQSQALDWLLRNDTWVPPQDATDPSGLWRERYAFATLFFDTNGPFWEVKGRWLSDESVCQWNSGIRCNLEGKVDFLQISDWSHIVGSIPPELKALTMLSHLDFSSHELGGSFPSEIATLTLLTRLDLRSNDLSGIIPTEIGMLSKLEGLYLRQNNLVGGLPSEIGRLTNLQYTFLDANLISGSIPTEIGLLTALREVSAFNNRLNGPLPSEIGMLVNMENLLLYDNELTGPIMSEIGLLTNMKWLSLYDNVLVGNIPSEMGRLTNMWRLRLSDNRLTGTIPHDFGVLYLEFLDIARNQLTGVFPVMTLDSRDSEPRCFMESNRFDDTSNAPSFCRF